MTKKANTIIERLEGTLIADLKSIKITAENRLNGVDAYKSLPGGLNFSLFLMGLIASETVGYFISKETDAGRSESNIRYFISSQHFKCTSYQKEYYLNILISLRTNLAHVFGMTELKLESISDDIDLCVGGSQKPEVLSGPGNVKLNGIKFVDCVIDAFESIKAEVLNNKVSNISTIISNKADITRG